jgi:hypothetical protein
MVSHIYPIIFDPSSILSVNSGRNEFIKSAPGVRRAGGKALRVRWQGVPKLQGLLQEISSGTPSDFKCPKVGLQEVFRVQNLGTTCTELEGSFLREARHQC